MSDPHKTLLGAARAVRDGHGATEEPAAVDTAPVPEPPLVPLPEPQECQICRAPGSQVPLLVMRGSEPLVRCVGRDACAQRLGDRQRRSHKPGAGTAEAGPTPPVPAPAPPTSSGTGADTQPPAAPVPGKTAAAEAAP